MTIQKRAILTLRYLKGAGISYKAFAQSAGINVESIYALTAPKYKLTPERADFYIRAVEAYYPDQYKIIKPRIDAVEKYMKNYPMVQ